MGKHVLSGPYQRSATILCNGRDKTEGDRLMEFFRPKANDLCAMYEQRRRLRRLQAKARQREAIWHDSLTRSDRVGVYWDCYRNRWMRVDPDIPF